MHLEQFVVSQDKKIFELRGTVQKYKRVSVMTAVVVSEGTHPAMPGLELSLSGQLSNVLRDV